MHRAIGAAILLITAANLEAAPLKEKPPTPISPNNVNTIREVATIDRDAARLDFLPESGDIVVTPWLGRPEVFDSRSLKPRKTMLEGKKLVQIDFSRDGARMAWVENNTRVTIEDFKTGKKISIDTGSSQPSVEFSPDGKWLATGGYGRSAALWDVASGKKLREFETDADGGLWPVFTADGKTLAIGNRNSDLRLFDPASGKLLHVLPKKMTQEIRFNPAGTIIAATYVDGCIGLWDVATGKSLHMAKSGGVELYSVDWCPKGDLLATCGLKAKIIVWDPKELKPLKEFDSPEWVIRVRFSPDGSRLLAAGGSMLPSPERRIAVFGLPGER
jgi:WD40 repeat protein